MAFLSSKKTPAKKTTKKSAPAVKTEVKKNPKDDGLAHNALTKPWFSEKSILKIEKGVYTFVVPQGATAKDVMKAIALSYGVVPVKVNMVHLPAKTKSLRTKRGVGVRTRRHKAYVYLAKGQTIQF